MLAIIIVNYKNEKRTISYVQKELVKIKIPHKIVIVNNQATVESNAVLVNELHAEFVSDIASVPNCNKRCYILGHPDNLGFAKGNNLGAEFSLKHFKVTHFLFTNNDIRFIDDNVVERLIEKITTLPDTALIGPKVIGLDGRSQSPEPYVSFWNRYVWMYWLTPFLSAKYKRKLFNLDYSKNAKEGAHYKVMGSFFLMKRADFVQCGMMDSNTFLYAEEVILSERLRALGKNVYFYPKVAVLHEHGATISQHLLPVSRMLTQYASESYYYKTYRNVNRISILIGKISVYCHIKLKEILN